MDISKNGGNVLEKGIFIDFFVSTMQKIKQEDDCSIYKTINDTGEGVITCYNVFPGINLLYNDFHMENGFNQNKLPKPNVMEINYCREGRFECEFKSGEYTYLGAGDMSVSMLSNETKSTSFPLSHFHGISITINLLEAAEYIEKISDVLGGISIDIFKVREKMCKKNRCIVIRGHKSIEHIFAELYTAPKEFIYGYFKVKVIELLMFLSSLKEKDYQKEQKYFDRNQVLIVKRIQNYMVEHIQEHISLEELSKMFNIPLTSMKNCFKGIYGISIYAYLKDYRINTAALLLRQTNDSITQIANRIGYENPSKFSEAFKKNMGMLPSEYRKSLSK
jgi:AraC-like DNA-binding protein